MYKHFLINSFLLTAVLGMFLPALVWAANFSVSPLIIDITAKQRDVFTHTLTITNHSAKPVRLYASVNEITVGENSEVKTFVPASMSDRSVAVTSWLEITRGRIELKAGEKTEVPLVIRVNHDTPPGLYHAYVGFGSATNNDLAQAQVQNGQGSGVVLRISVGDKKQEFLKLTSFVTDRFSFSDKKGNISFSLKNTGDVPLTPKGDIIIYDARGRELATVNINQAGDSVIDPGAEILYEQKLPFINRLGKHKAYLNVEYGVENRAALYDTYFYYSIPKLYLIAIAILLMVILVTLILLQRRSVRYNNYEEPDLAYDVTVFVSKQKEHSEYEHDINLKKKDN